MVGHRPTLPASHNSTTIIARRRVRSRFLQRTFLGRDGALDTLRASHNPIAVIEITQVVGIKAVAQVGDPPGGQLDA